MSRSRQLHPLHLHNPRCQDMSCALGRWQPHRGSSSPGACSARQLSFGEAQDQVTSASVGMREGGWCCQSNRGASGGVGSPWRPTLVQGLSHSPVPQAAPHPGLPKGSGSQRKQDLARGAGVCDTVPPQPPPLPCPKVAAAWTP